MKKGKREEKKEILVLDDGIDLKEMAGIQSICCRGPFSAGR